MPDLPEYQQLRQKRLKPRRVTYGEEDLLQLSRVGPHYFLPERLYVEPEEDWGEEEEEDWWDSLTPHDRI